MAKTQDYNLGPFTYPRGWFMVAEGAQVGSTPVSERFFGEDVVLFRGASGKVAMIDAYCPHMGTHLGRNKSAYLVRQGEHVQGDTITCPFHGWRFGLDGTCKEIPYHDGPIPEQARVKSWHVEERYGIVFCWHDPEGLAPDIPLPECREWDDPQWVRWQVDHLGTLPTHPQEVLDNASDVRHLSALHGEHVLWYENEVDGPILHQRQCGQSIGTGDNVSLSRFTTIVRYTGPALMTAHFYFINDVKEPTLFQMIAHTPVEDGSTRLWQATMMRSSKRIIDDEVRAAARRLNEQIKHGIMEDFEAWTYKRPALKILQLPTDGPFGRSRTWYKQFYNPRDQTQEILKPAQGLHGAKGCPTRKEYAGNTGDYGV